MSVDELDYLVVGSGFGGSVSALRLAEKGWKVAVLEQGNKIGPDEIKAAKAQPLSKLTWLPALRKRGYSVQHFFKHVGILGGVGVGGGSLVWGAVMLPPKPEFYDAAIWRELGIDMRSELAPYLKEAARMLGVSANPKVGKQDEYLRQAAAAMGRAETWGSVPQAIYFGKAAEEGEAHCDPFFAGEGPARTPCSYCGECLAGCEYGSKNSLDQNYLYLAQKLGVRVHSDARVIRIRQSPHRHGGYEVDYRSGGRELTLHCRKLVLSAGVVGTLDLLLRSRFQHRTLPNVSPSCGVFVRTNSEALTGVFSRDAKASLLREGAAISSDYYADDHTHITQNRIAPALAPFLRMTLVPMIDEPNHRLRVLKTLLAMLCRPQHWLPAWFGRNWSGRMTTLTVMQNDDSGVRLRLKRGWFNRWKLRSENPQHGNRAPSYLPIANAATRAFAKAANGIPLSSVFEALAGKAMTAHILGGCPMSKEASKGVIDGNHEVHGHPGLFVVDGSAIPANLGVNPSLTIAAMAERFAALQPRSENLKETASAQRIAEEA